MHNVNINIIDSLGLDTELHLTGESIVFFNANAKYGSILINTRRSLALKSRMPGQTSG